MARERIKLASLSRQIELELGSKLAIGESKHEAKKMNTAQNNIYSWSTYRTYMKHSNYFASWAKEKHGSRTLQEARAHVDEWLQKRMDDGLSAYTQKLEASALAKLYGCKTTDFIETEVRHRANITRSRLDVARDKNFSERKNSTFVDFCRSTGLRRAELNNLTGDKLVYRDEKPCILVDSGAKGGKIRYAPIIGNAELVIEKMKSAGFNKVFEKIPAGADIHSYRAEYATTYYNQIARPIESISYDRVNKASGGRYQSQVYHCKGDLKGVKYDKIAMAEVSRALGHNRISVIAGHYLK